LELKILTSFDTIRYIHIMAICLHNFVVIWYIFGHLVYIVAIWYIYFWHLVYFVAIWYIMWYFGIFFDDLVYFVVI
jgi:hypothetical protein